MKGETKQAGETDLFHSLVGVRLLGRHVRVVQRVLKANAAVVALEAT